MVDDKIYRDLVKLGQTRCREAALSVFQLIDDEEQRVGLLINLVVELVAGAVQYLRENNLVDSEEEAHMTVIAGMVYGIGASKFIQPKGDQSVKNTTKKRPKSH
jgi:hypothetical protein